MAVVETHPKKRPGHDPCSKLIARLATRWGALPIGVAFCVMSSLILCVPLGGLLGGMDEGFTSVFDVVLFGFVIGLFLSVLLLLPLLLVLLMSFFLTRFIVVESSLDRAKGEALLLLPLPLIPFVFAWSPVLSIRSSREAASTTAPPTAPAWIFSWAVDFAAILIPIVGIIVAMQVGRRVYSLLPAMVHQRGEPKCPSCKYPLTGLPKPICPECGYEAQHVELESLNPKSDSA